MNLKKILLLGGVGLAATAVGIAIPQVLSGSKSDNSTSSSAEAAHGAKASQSGKPGSDKKPATDKSGDHGKPSSPGGDSGHSKGNTGGDITSGPGFVQFGRIVVNLNDPSLAKYLSLEITLQTDGLDVETVKAAVEMRLPILRTWLTSHLADKTVEDIRGKVGVNRLRREIQDQFNSLLFQDGQERVQDVLFEEFHVE
ncbi:MAG: flagellar basal body-associated FliL family protein [Planctomycetales bacterium]|nr:flagellar basal body-associated FliL family protein [Planctomycetales bacterium]